MEKVYRKKLILGLLTLQLVFLIIFTFAYVNYAAGRPLLDIGLGYRAENLIVMGFSLLSMVNIIYELSVIKR